MLLKLYHSSLPISFVVYQPGLATPYIDELNALKEEIEILQGVQTQLRDLPKRLDHKVMIPIGSLALRPGKVLHSNEILVKLDTTQDGNTLVWRSAGNDLLVLPSLTLASLPLVLFD